MASLQICGQISSLKFIGVFLGHWPNGGVKNSNDVIGGACLVNRFLDKMQPGGTPVPE